jgi:hypothetical protein
MTELTVHQPYWSSTRGQGSLTLDFCPHMSGESSFAGRLLTALTSLRQCFLALGVLASNDWKFVEHPEFNVAQVRFSVNNSGNLLTSDPSSASRRSLHSKRPYVRRLSETKSAPRRRYPTYLARRRSFTGPTTGSQRQRAYPFRALQGYQGTEASVYHFCRLRDA